MIFSFVLWCLFGSPIQCVLVLSENRNVLVSMALRMRNVDTGYPDEPHTDNFIRNSDIHALREIIQTKVDQLFCRYTTSVVDHMESTKTLFHGPMRNREMECIGLFNDVAKEMIGTLYKIGDPEIDGLWLYVVYVNELAKYFRSVTAGDGPMLAKHAAELYRVHEKVTRYLKCATIGRLGGDYGLSERRASSESQSVDFAANLDAVQTLMANNRAHGVVADNSYSFTASQLYLNDAVVDQQLMAGLQLLVSDLQIDLSWLYAQLTELNANAHDFLLLSHGPRSIDTYHDLLFDFLELVVLRFARKHVFLVLYDTDRRMASAVDLFFDSWSLYRADNSIMSRQTNAMMWLFKIDNEWLKECKVTLRRIFSTNKWKAMDTAGRQEEDRIIKKHNLVNAIRVDLNPSVVTDTFQSVLKLASSRGIRLTDRAPDLDKNDISPVRMNIITMDVTYKYFVNVLFRDVKFSLLNLFRHRKTQTDTSDGNEASTSR